MRTVFYNFCLSGSGFQFADPIACSLDCFPNLTFVNNPLGQNPGFPRINMHRCPDSLQAVQCIFNAGRAIVTGHPGNFSFRPKTVMGSFMIRRTCASDFCRFFSAASAAFSGPSHGIVYGRRTPHSQSRDQQNIRSVHLSPRLPPACAPQTEQSPLQPVQLLDFRLLRVRTAAKASRPPISSVSRISSKLMIQSSSGFRPFPAGFLQVR